MRDKRAVSSAECRVVRIQLAPYIVLNCEKAINSFEHTTTTDIRYILSNRKEARSPATCFYLREQ